MLKFLSKYGGGAALVYFGIRGYQEAVREKHWPKPLALAAAVADMAAFQAFPWIYGFATFVPGIYQGAKFLSMYGRIQRNYFNEMVRPFSGNRFIDSEYAASMRQRALQLIAQSRINARTGLGNEARYFAKLG